MKDWQGPKDFNEAFVTTNFKYSTDNGFNQSEKDKQVYATKSIAYCKQHNCYVQIKAYDKKTCLYKCREMSDNKEKKENILEVEPK